ncbi:MAG: hypothetical protein J4N83_01635 [Chloroflexi bacterium]|nr:hypothetical protein [Chloroflexota bacterium]
MTASDQLEQPQQIEETLDETLYDPPGEFTPMQDHFLRRLRDLAHKREEFMGQENQDPLEHKLLARTIYATLMDCVGEGVGDQAHAILGDGQVIGRS